MTAHPTTPITPRALRKPSLTGYETRVELVTRALTEHSQLPADEARMLAKHALHAIDTIPERIR